MKPGDIFKLIRHHPFYVDFPVNKTIKTLRPGKNLILIKIKKSGVDENHHWFHFLGGFICGNNDTMLPSSLLEKIG